MVLFCLAYMNAMICAVNVAFYLGCAECDDFCDDKLCWN